MSKSYEVIVVGAGVEGLATAAHLAKELHGTGKKVVLLEQYMWPHSRGSSFGATRITRLSYSDPIYAGLMPKAFKTWETIEQKTGMELYRQSGILVMAPEGSVNLGKYQKAMDVHSYKYELMDRNQIMSRFPQFTVPPGYMGMYEKTGGLVCASKALEALMNIFKSYGGVFRDNEPVLEVIPKTSSSHSTIVKTSKGEYHASAGVILTMGPWAPSFLKNKLKLNLPIEPHKTVFCYWKVKKPGVYDISSGSPTVMVMMKNQNYSYYMKTGWEFDGLVQLGLHMGRLTDPDNRDDPSLPGGTLEADYVRMSKDFGAQFMPHVDLTAPVLVDSCIYTENFIDRGFILDKHPDCPDIVIGAGFSGHGFKLAPVVGEILSNLVLNRSNGTLNMSNFSVKRLMHAKL